MFSGSCFSLAWERLWRETKRQLDMKGLRGYVEGKAGMGGERGYRAMGVLRGK